MTTIEHNGGLYLAEVTLQCYPGSLGRIWGDPDDCYPPYPPMAEVNDIKIVDIEDNGNESFVGKHVNWKIDIDELTDRVFEEQANADEAAWDEYCERKFDAIHEGDR